MKKSILFILLTFIIQTEVFSQSCLPDGITFSTQSEIDSFQTNYPNCTEIEGDVEISGNDITNLNGLNVLTAFGGNFWIYYNTALTSLTGLDNLTSIGGSLKIWNNDVLTSLTGLEKLTSIAEDLLIQRNNAQVSLTGLDNLISIGGNLSIKYNDILPSLTGLNNVTSVGGWLWFIQNNSLISFTGLEKVTAIGGEVRVYHNKTLTSLTGLNNLTSISGGLVVIGNDELINLNGLDNVTSIEGSIRIEYNTSLTSLSGLNNLNFIDGELLILNNHALISLTGLDNLYASSIVSLVIFDNISLSKCDVKSICSYLDEPGASISIFTNAIGCNTQKEVEEACDASAVLENNFRSEFSIHPNPATNKIFITSKNGLKIETVNIYNQLGQMVLHRNEIRDNIDISTLGQGIYIIELTLNELKIREKLLIEK